MIKLTQDQVERFMQLDITDIISLLNENEVDGINFNLLSVNKRTNGCPICIYRNKIGDYQDGMVLTYLDDKGNVSLTTVPITTDYNHNTIKDCTVTFYNEYNDIIKILDRESGYTYETKSDKNRVWSKTRCVTADNDEIRTITQRVQKNENTITELTRCTLHGILMNGDILTSSTTELFPTYTKLVRIKDSDNNLAKYHSIRMMTKPQTTYKKLDNSIEVIDTYNNRLKLRMMNFNLKDNYKYVVELILCAEDDNTATYVVKKGKIIVIDDMTTLKYYDDLERYEGLKLILPEEEEEKKNND